VKLGVIFRRDFRLRRRNPGTASPPRLRLNHYPRTWARAALSQVPIAQCPLSRECNPSIRIISGSQELVRRCARLYICQSGVYYSSECPPKLSRTPLLTQLSTNLGEAPRAHILHECADVRPLEIHVSVE